MLLITQSKKSSYHFCKQFDKKSLFKGGGAMMSKMKITAISLIYVIALMFPTYVNAVDFSYSGFGTFGGAISDNKTTYQRYIDDHGTLMRDSLLGVQVDAKFNNQWAATTQVVIAPSADEDNVVKPQLKWTLLSYRPTNDWLIRAGRMSLGGLLNQQNLDVGVTYDMVRLPSEVYLISSSYDFDGLSAVKTWNISGYEISLDGSLGKQKRYYRSYYNGSETPSFYSADVTAGSLVLTVNDNDQAMYRFGWNIAEIDPDDPEGLLSKFTFTPLGGGLYTLGKPVYKSTTQINTFFLGARFPLGGFLLSCEGTAVLPNDFEAAPPTLAAYASLSHKFGNWTPYLTYAQTWTSGMDTWRKVKGATAVPQLGITQADIDNAASAMGIFEQNSWMVGTSYAITPKQKLKAEVMLTHVGERSAMFDGSIANQNVTVLSLSYNFAF
jgi:hypothetical protein